MLGFFQLGFQLPAPFASPASHKFWSYKATFRSQTITVLEHCTNTIAVAISVHVFPHLPKEVSAVNECLVPLLDSKTKPGRSSFNIVACWPSELWIAISPSFRQVRDQFPTVSLAGPGVDKIGWLVVDAFTWLRALCNFSKNSLRLSVKKKRKLEFDF